MMGNKNCRKMMPNIVEIQWCKSQFQIFTKPGAKSKWPPWGRDGQGGERGMGAPCILQSADAVLGSASHRLGL